VLATCLVPIVPVLQGPANYSRGPAVVLLQPAQNRKGNDLAVGFSPQLCRCRFSRLLRLTVRGSLAAPLVGSALIVVLPVLFAYAVQLTFPPYKHLIPARAAN
jgi:hypothetical protein